MGLTTETTLWFNTNLVNVGASVMSGKNTGVQARVKFYVSGTKSGQRYKGKIFKVHLESYKG